MARILLIIAGFALISICIANETNGTSQSDKEIKTRVLSRRKRFLTFPDGSSFQLVFCTQTHGYLQVGDIVWFGTTAALAWELPTDPSFFHLYKQYERMYTLRRQDTKHIIYLDEDGKIISAVPYKRKPIVNPAFAKRSVDITKDVNTVRVSIKDMHKLQINKTQLKDLDAPSIEFHREGRKSFYEKMEKFIEGVGWRGKECILRMLCESGNAKKKQGTFVDEILRAMFTFPKSQNPGSYHKEYDEAHGKLGDCEELYPACEERQGKVLVNSK